MKYLVNPLPSYAANAPVRPNNHERYFTIASEHSSLVLGLREDLRWQHVSGKLRQVEVGSDGSVWGLNMDDAFIRREGNKWKRLSGRLRQISVGDAKNVWGLNLSGEIRRWVNGRWQRLPGTLRSISAAADGTVWGVNDEGEILVRRGADWQRVDGKLRQIAVGSSTNVWGVNDEGEIYTFARGGWHRIEGNKVQLSVAADGAVWGVNREHEIYRWRGDGWERVPGRKSHISVGSSSAVWGVNPENETYYNAGAGHGQVVQEIWTGSARQQWRFLPYLTSGYQLRNREHDQVLHVRDHSREPGAELVAGSPEQSQTSSIWKVVDLGDGRFQIGPRRTNLSLDVYRDSLEAGAKVVVWPWHGRGNQRWRLGEVRPVSEVNEREVRVYDQPGYRGRWRAISMGRFNVLRGANDAISSLHVPPGMRVRLFEHRDFNGAMKEFCESTPDLGDMNNRASSLIVEKVVTIYRDRDYKSAAIRLGVGKHNRDFGWKLSNALSSLRVPQGMSITIFDRDDFQGEQRVFFEDTPYVGDEFNDRMSSVIVRHLGVAFPRESVRFGGKIQLRGAHGKWLVAERDGALNANRPRASAWETFTIERAGPTQHTSHVAYGDVIALRSTHGKYLTAEGGGAAKADRDELLRNEKWVVVRSGTTASNVFVSHRDTISLRSWRDTYLVAERDGRANADRTEPRSWERWVITGYEPPNRAPGEEAPYASPVCDSNVCATEACGADACGAEVCGVDHALLNVCGAASPVIALCAADVAVLSGCEHQALSCVTNACASAARGGIIDSLLACSVDACGAATACGTATCGANVCGAAACAIEAGGGTACGADACGINACFLDACGADACGIDIIPGIPGI